MSKRFAVSSLAAALLASMLLMGGCPQPTTESENPDVTPEQNDNQAPDNNQQAPAGDEPVSNDDAAKGNDPAPEDNGDVAPPADNPPSDGGSDPAPEMPTEPPPGYTWDDLWDLLAVYEQTGELDSDLNGDGVVNQVDLGTLIWLLMTQV
jgi:hypothetical protein